MADAVLTLPPGRPERSLGLQVMVWCSTYIRQPDGPEAGGPWRFTPEQARFLDRWFSVDERGRWVYARGTYRRAKGAGKTPMVAALALAELCGPVRFGGWNDDGSPHGVPCPAPWVQLAGVSEKQTVNTMSMVLAMCAESPIVDDYGLDLGLTRIYIAGGGGKLEPITASAPTAEGARPSFVVEDETHHWTESNNGTDLDRVNRRNLGKSRDGSARMLETTNAHAVGQDSVAERSYLAWLAIVEGRSRGSLLYDAREAPPDTDMSDEAELMAGLEAAYGDSTWVDLERIRDEVWDPSTPPEDSRRFYLNTISAATDAWLTEPEWAGCLDGSKVVADRDTITLGFDGSRSRSRRVTDATALIGCRVSDGHLFEVAVWEQPPGPAGNDWQVPTSAVEAAVRATFARYTVVGFFADPAKWESFVAGWEAEYGSRLRVKATREHPCQYWMVGGRTRTVVRALEQFQGAVVDGDLTHDGSFAMSRHVLNARRRPTPAGLTISKAFPDSAAKIDAAVAAVLAWQARLDAIAAGVGADQGTFVPRRVR